MGLAENGWEDRRENYADGAYTKILDVSTADNIMGIDVKRPIVLYNVVLSPSQTNASGMLTLVDTSATGDAGTQKFVYVITSAATTSRQSGVSIEFPRGLVFNDGLVVSALTLSGGVTLVYKARHS